jgi:hypothetical protein
MKADIYQIITEKLITSLEKEMPKDQCSHLVKAYWEGWIEGFNQELPPELCIQISA